VIGARLSLADDTSAAAIAAGFVTVLVGFTSSAALVFQAARAFDAGPAEIGSWILALGVGMGATCILLSLRYRVPVFTAWSTPGAAMLITAATGVSMNEAIGAFALNLAAITAAICMGREAHEDPARRYRRAVCGLPAGAGAGDRRARLVRHDGRRALGRFYSSFGFAYTGRGTSANAT
jgi:benzoate membrane transport protein